MGVIKEKVFVQRPNEDSRSSDEEWVILSNNNNNQSDSFSEDDEVVPTPRRRQEIRFHKSQSLSTRGHTLALKKGRRSRHRFENEKLLTTNEEQLIWDVVDRSPNSPKFSSLDDETLSLFCYGEFENYNEDVQRKPKNKVSYEPEDFDPEVAYLNIGCNLRTALKKNLPMGMLAGLESEIIDFFTKNPQSSYIAEELSSYERLLAHACSSYHCLYSYSFNESGRRKLKIANPNQIFYKPDPSLSSYLQERFHKQ
ncbi:R3H domain-containing protein 4 [Lepeophtheirus salmonis]|uniref:R3H domain-containing protein 4 n=1 Tax=Lepeophtheirus salmonis TaxID=72036 RepID=UPI001AE38998|nr:R3H domain-containing protein 4-like [Lepeophtheirus salmonis]